MIDLDAIQARLDASNPDPWVHGDDTLNADGTIQSANILSVGILGANPWAIACCHGGPTEPEEGRDTRGLQATADAAFIAHAHQDVPALITEVRRLRDALTDVAKHQEDMADSLDDHITHEDIHEHLLIGMRAANDAREATQ